MDSDAVALWGGYDSCIFIFFVVILEMMNKSL